MRLRQERLKKFEKSRNDQPKQLSKKSTFKLPPAEPTIFEQLFKLSGKLLLEPARTFALKFRRKQSLLKLIEEVTADYDDECDRELACTALKKRSANSNVALAFYFEEQLEVSLLTVSKKLLKKSIAVSDINGAIAADNSRLLAKSKIARVEQKVIRFEQALARHLEEMSQPWPSIELNPNLYAKQEEQVRLREVKAEASGKALANMPTIDISELDNAELATILPRVQSGVVELQELHDQVLAVPSYAERHEAEIDIWSKRLEIAASRGDSHSANLARLRKESFQRSLVHILENESNIQSSAAAIEAKLQNLVEVETAIKIKLQ